MESSDTSEDSYPVPLWRLYLLRAFYLLMVVGLAIVMWPRLIGHAPDGPLMSSVVAALLGTLGLLCVLGLRYPLDMLPLLLFELFWKMIWLFFVALPLWRIGALDAAARQTAFDCALGLVLILVIPWGYVFDRYVRRSGDRWR